MSKTKQMQHNNRDQLPIRCFLQVLKHQIKTQAYDDDDDDEESEKRNQERNNRSHPVVDENNNYDNDFNENPGDAEQYQDDFDDEDKQQQQQANIMFLLTMQPSVRTRFDEVYALATSPPIASTSDVDPIVSRAFSLSDADQLVSNGFAQVIDAAAERAHPTRGALTAFTVVEKDSRRRAIHWPREINAAVMSGGYKPSLPLDHISKYLPAVHSECGGSLDLRCSFWQIPLPQNARPYYRFRDASGRLLEMKVVVMGHVCSVEIMQILTSVLAGDPSVVQHQYRAPAKCHVWVDNILFFGNQKEVEKSLALAKQAAVDLYAEFKDPVFTSTKQVEFIGVWWDFAAKTVRVADKTFNKLPDKAPSELSAREVERLVGRLIFTAGITQSPLVHFYFALKWAKRICNGLNNGTFGEDDLVKIPASVSRQFGQWLASAKLTHSPRLSDRDSEAPVLFVDATLKGYGGVLVLPSRRVYITGMKFDDGADYSINVREAMGALYSIEDFSDILKQYRNLDLRLDNTSVEAAIARGTAKADKTAAVVAQVLKKSVALNINISASRVGSKENPADAPSRECDVSVNILTNAMGKNKVKSTMRRGAGRLFC